MLRIYISIVLLAWAIPVNAALIDKTAAVVNSEVITLSDIHAFKKNYDLHKELDPFLSYFQKAPKDSKETLEYLVQEALILQKFPTSKEEVEEEINHIQRNNKIDRSRLQEALNAQGILFESYEAMMKVSASKRKLIDRELRPFSTVTDEEVKNFYYTAPEFLNTAKARKLVLSYHLEQLALSSKAAADNATKRLRMGDSMDSVASELGMANAEYSDLGMLVEDRLSPIVLTAIQGLRVGEFSAHISTGSGFLILRIREIGAPQDQVFEKEKENIRNRLFQKAIESHLVIWTEQERAQSYVYIP